MENGVAQASLCGKCFQQMGNIGVLGVGIALRSGRRDFKKAE